MESKGTTVVASCIHQALTDSHRYTTLTDATVMGELLIIIASLSVTLLIPALLIAFLVILLRQNKK